MALRPLQLRHVRWAWPSQSATTIWARGIRILLANSLFKDSPTTISRKTILHHRVYSSLPPTAVASDSTRHVKMGESTKLVMFHNPYSTLSCNILATLNRAREAYPSKRRGPPLEFDLSVETRLPTIEELQGFHDLSNAPSWAFFLDAHGADHGFRVHPTNPRALLEGIASLQARERSRVRDNLSQHTESSGPYDSDHPLFGTTWFTWPVVVCWDERLISVGNEKEVKGMLRLFAQRRSGIDPAQVEEKRKREEIAKYSIPPKEESPPEDDTIKWFNETKQPYRRRPHSFGLSTR